ncbi:hypothetical protein [Aliikangiella sp. IMCC44359]|uniref:hypothetical protein n=1 Tax=Aliikangiella sp. IMCC44359 TaxID=3459125 RepID=UPI00403AD3C9
MWITKPEYPIKPNVQKIQHHEQLPAGVVELARLKDDISHDNSLWVLLKNEGILSILNPMTLTMVGYPPEYICPQHDFPMAMLPWFSRALTEFQKPPAEGGLHAGAMSGGDEEVGGEMLCIERAMGVDNSRGGYSVVNRSRCLRKYFDQMDTMFEPHEICWPDRFLYDGGMLNLITQLGQRVEAGDI